VRQEEKNDSVKAERNMGEILTGMQHRQPDGKLLVKKKGWLVPQASRLTSHAVIAIRRASGHRF